MPAHWAGAGSPVIAITGLDIALPGPPASPVKGRPPPVGGGLLGEPNERARMVSVEL